MKTLLVCLAVLLLADDTCGQVRSGGQSAMEHGRDNRMRALDAEMRHNSQQLFAQQETLRRKNGMDPTARDPKLRKWTDQSGKFSVVAEFVELKNGRVTLRKESGDEVKVALARLCKKDQALATGKPQVRRTGEPRR